MTKESNKIAVATPKKPLGRPRKSPAKQKNKRKPRTKAIEKVVTVVSVDPVVLDTYGRAELHKKAEKLFGKPAKVADNINKLIDEYDKRIDEIIAEIDKLEDVKAQFDEERSTLESIMEHMGMLGHEFEVKLHEAAN